MQQQQLSEDWRPQACVQRQQLSEDWRPQTYVQQQQLSEDWRPQTYVQQQQLSEDWRPQACVQYQPSSLQPRPSVGKASEGLVDDDHEYCEPGSAAAARMSDLGASFPPSMPCIGRGDPASADHSRWYQKQHDRPHCGCMSGLAMEVLPEFHINAAGVAATAAAAGQRPHAEAADGYFMIAVPTGSPLLTGPAVLQTGSGIASEANCSGCPDPKAAADRPWWAQLLEEEETASPS